MKPDFTPYLNGISASQEKVLADLRSEVKAAGSTLANASPYSPFYKLLGALVAKPVLYLRGVLTESIMPGMFLNTATGTLLNLKAAEFGLERRNALPAEGNVVFSRASTTGTLSIPQGTRVESPPIDGKVYALSTTQTVLFASTSATVRAPVQALQAGAAFNLGAGLYTIVPDPPAGVAGVGNQAGWLTKAGRDVEKDAALRRRCLLQVQRLGQGTHGYYHALIAEEAGIDPADIFNGTYGTSTGRGAFGSRDYHYLLPTGQPSATQLAKVNALLTRQHLDGDSVRVKALPALRVAVVLTLYAAADTPAETQRTMQATATSAIQGVFRQNASHGSLQRVRPNQVVPWLQVGALLASQYPHLKSVRFSPAEVRPSLQLPTLTSLTITVEVA